MNIKKIVSEEMQQNCYLLEQYGEGILIDPGIDTIKILKETDGIKITHILFTHCHYDHIYSACELQKPCAGSVNCKSNIQDGSITLLQRAVNFEPFYEIDDGEECMFGKIKIKCLYTPGHTSCGACYIYENNVFTGDTLFCDTVGRWDLPTGNYKELVNSIKNVLYKLPDDYRVFPGHAGETTIGHEKKFGLVKDE